MQKYSSHEQYLSASVCSWPILLNFALNYVSYNNMCIYISKKPLCFYKKNTVPFTETFHLHFQTHFPLLTHLNVCLLDTYFSFLF